MGNGTVDPASDGSETGFLRLVRAEDQHDLIAALGARKADVERSRSGDSRVPGEAPSFPLPARPEEDDRLRVRARRVGRYGVAVALSEQLSRFRARGTGDAVAVEDEDGDARARPKRLDMFSRDTAGTCYRRCLHGRVMHMEEAGPGEREQRGELEERDGGGREGCCTPGEGAIEGMDVLHGPSRFVLRAVAPASVGPAYRGGSCS